VKICDSSYLIARLVALKPKIRWRIEDMVNEAIEMWLDSEGDALARSEEKRQRERHQK
jgi:hypothetical protein